MKNDLIKLSNYIFVSIEFFIWKCFSKNQKQNRKGLNIKKDLFICKIYVLGFQFDSMGKKIPVSSFREGRLIGGN